MNAHDLINLAKYFGIYQYDQMSFGYASVYYIDYNESPKPIAKLIQHIENSDIVLAYCEGDEAQYLIENFR